MTNPHFTKIEQYRDIESRNYYRILREQDKTEAETLDIIAQRSRDEMCIRDRLYAGVQRFERSFRQRLFSVSCKGRGQRDENADREDRIWRQTMKYAGMPFGMWMLFAGSFQKQLTTVLGYDAATAKAITKKAKPQ